MGKPIPERISQPEALKLISPFMKSSTWYNTVRKNPELLDRLDCRIGVNNRVTLDRAEFMTWLDELKGVPATEAATTANFRMPLSKHRRSGKQGARIAFLTDAFNKGQITKEMYETALDGLLGQSS